MALTNLLILAGATAAAWLLTLAAERLGHALNLVDTPVGPLKIHSRATPRFGGLAVIFTLWLAYVAGTLAGTVIFGVPALITATLLFVLGTWDDFKPRSAVLRLVLQSLIFALSWQMGLRVPIVGPVWLDAIVAYGLFIVVVNAVNFYDGMDGLLAFTALCALGVWSAVSADLGGVWLPEAVAACALLGFLPRNWHPARTFLGDGGSFVVGFLFYLVFVTSQAQSSHLLEGFWVAAVPVCDAVAATLDRLSRHGNVFAGDRDHVYDILGRLGLSTSQVALVLGLVAALGARGTAFIAEVSVPEAAMATVVLYAVLILVILALRRRFRLGTGGLEIKHRDRGAL